ncbi:MAG: GNAT family N-acetyltransferase [Candidatus Norongarragalinales archaeon]
MIRTVLLEASDEKAKSDFETLAKAAGFDDERISEFEGEIASHEAFATLAYCKETDAGEEKPVAFYVSRRVDKMPKEKIDERFKKRMDAARRWVEELKGKSDKELAREIADSGNSFVLEEYRGKGIGRELYAAHERDAKKLGYSFKFEAARAPDEEGDAQRILLKTGYLNLGELGYSGRRYNKPLYGFIKKL